MNALEAHQITPIDLVAVNLYPFRETATRKNATAEQVIEQIDIGGPSMLRSAAKNFASVWVIVDPADYGRVLGAIHAFDIDPDLREKLRGKVQTEIDQSLVARQKIDQVRLRNIEKTSAAAARDIYGVGI